MTMREVAQAVRREFDECLAADGSVDLSLLSLRVTTARPLPESEHADFYVCCTHSQVHNIVSKFVRDMKPKLQASRQQVFPGFDYVQPFYVITRNGRSVAVRTVECSSDELLMKAEELEAQATGLQAHAVELRRYVAERDAVAAE